VNAFLYLVRTSARNRFLYAARRVRSPRYAFALVIGALYIWSFLFRPVNRLGETNALLGRPTEVIVTVLLAITLMGAWLFGSDASALAFSQAEVSMLFPAPLSRRSLIVYKLMRAQVAVVINALIWVFVLRRGGTLLPPALRALGLWVLFSTLNLHRLGAALVRSSWREHGRSGARRHAGSILVFVAIGVSILLSLVHWRRDLAAVQGVGGFFTVLTHALSEAPASWGLYPFHLIVAPSFAHTVAEWSAAIGPAAIVMAIHAWWVLRTDAAFEDAAIEASAERARRLLSRSRRAFAPVGTSRAAPSTIPLASAGHPALAIFWKNMLCLRRTAQLPLFIGPMIMAIAIGAALSDGRGEWSEIAAVCIVAMAATLLLFGGRLIRNDLRQDMQHLPLLKTLPISPGHIVLAEVASAAVPMIAAQIILLALAWVVLLFSPNDPMGLATRTAYLVAAPFAVAALNGALLTIQNGTAVLFPAWIRLGPTVSTGVETLGQNVLATAANLISLALALVVPVFVGWAAASLAGGGRAIPIALSTILASLLLAAETYGAVRLLGRALGRAEPLQAV
jgi:ABC-2 type transport system permease protein